MTGACRVRVVNVVAGCVMFCLVRVRSYLVDVAWLYGFRPATLAGAGGGRCLTTRPQLRVRVVKHLKEGCGGVAGMACGWFGGWCVVGPGGRVMVEMV